MATKRKVFYSFHYDNDVFRVQLVRNIGSLEDNQPVTTNEWEEVKKGGDKAIEKWIADTMKDRSCIVVLVGEQTAQRPWIKYEIQKAWKDGKAVLGIYVHNISCMRTKKENPASGGTCKMGSNPFDQFSLGETKLSAIVKCYNPNPSDAYNHVRENLEKWIEEAIQIRSQYLK